MGKTLEERKYDFLRQVQELGEDHDTTQEFYDYWAEHNPDGKKMRFEMEKNQPFNPKRRMATWKRNQKRFGATEKKKESFLKNRYGLE